MGMLLYTYIQLLAFHSFIQSFVRSVSVLSMPMRAMLVCAWRTSTSFIIHTHTLTPVLFNISRAYRQSCKTFFIQFYSVYVVLLFDAQYISMSRCFYTFVKLAKGTVYFIFLAQSSTLIFASITNWKQHSNFNNLFCSNNLSFFMNKIFHIYFFNWRPMRACVCVCTILLSPIK